MATINGIKISKKTTQLHNFQKWNIDNLIFCDPKPEMTPDSITNYRINIMTTNQQLDEHGQEVFDQEGKPVNLPSMGEAMTLLGRYFSFGVSEGKNKGEVISHSLPMAMWSRDGVLSEELAVTDKIQQIIEKCKDFVYEVRKQIKKPKMEKTDLKGMDKLLFWKTDEEGERIQGEGPTVSPKLVEWKEKKDPKTGKIRPYSMSTIFYLENEVNEHGDPVEVSPFDYISDKDAKQFKLMYVTPVVKWDSIYIASDKVTIQLKVTETYIDPLQATAKKFLPNARYRELMNSNKVTEVKSGLNPLIRQPKTQDEKKDLSPKSPVTAKPVPIDPELVAEKGEPELTDAPAIKKKVIRKVTQPTK
jgi:hypothetical protein